MPYKLYISSTNTDFLDFIREIWIVLIQLFKLIYKMSYSSKKLNLSKFWYYEYARHFDEAFFSGNNVSDNSRILDFLEELSFYCCDGSLETGMNIPFITSIWGKLQLFRIFLKVCWPHFLRKKFPKRHYHWRLGSLFKGQARVVYEWSG